MKLLVVSDSHGSVKRLQSAIDAETPFDCLIHCGDGVRDLIYTVVPPGVRVLKVSGNIDLSVVFDMDRRLVETIDGYRFLITHGDMQGAHHDFLGLMREGRAERCDAVLFGHTHRQYYHGGEPLLFNPGAMQSGLYGVIMIDGGIEFLHRSLPRERS